MVANGHSFIRYSFIRHLLRCQTVVRQLSISRQTMVILSISQLRNFSLFFVICCAVKRLSNNCHLSSGIVILSISQLRNFTTSLCSLSFAALSNGCQAIVNQLSNNGQSLNLSTSQLLFVLCHLLRCQTVVKQLLISRQTMVILSTSQLRNF